VNELAEICYIDQLRSDAAYHKRREIKSLLLKFKGGIISNEVAKRRSLGRKAYIAERAMADKKL
jgi:hypothetical protein